MTVLDKVIVALILAVYGTALAYCLAQVDWDELW